MQFRFIGDADGDGPEVLTAFGLSFPKGQPVEVTDAAIQAKLEGNSHFERVATKEPTGGNKGRAKKSGSPRT